MSRPSSQEDAQQTEPETSEPQQPRRYGFSRFFRDAWGHYRRATASLTVVFCSVHVVAALLPYLVTFEIPDPIAYPLAFLLRVVLPVVLGSTAVAIGTVLVMTPDEPNDRAALHPGLAAATDRARNRAGGVLALALVASAMGTGAVLFLGAYGFLLLHLFYGPPIAIQLVAGEGLDYRDALQRARSLLRGNWRMILYLVNAALGIGAVSLLVLDASVRIVGTGSGTVGQVSLAILQGVVVGTLTAFMVGAQVAVYRYLLDRYEDDPNRSPDGDAAAT